MRSVTLIFEKETQFYKQDLSNNLKPNCGVFDVTSERERAEAPTEIF